MAGRDWSGLRSQRARPETPCSRRAVAASRARVPAPPVTGRVSDQAFFEL